MGTKKYSTPFLSQNFQLSAADESGERWNLGEIQMHNDRIEFIPNNVRTGGDDAKRFAEEYIAANATEIRQRFAAIKPFYEI